MTDKQIMIDGVDVSGCEHRCDTLKTLLADGHIMEFANYCQITNDGCYAVDCYYKQLKAKEQECERLKEGYSELTDIVSPYMDDFTGYNEELGGFDIVLCVKELMEQLDQLKAENDNLKSLIYWLHYGAEDTEKVINEYYETRNTSYEENFWKRIKSLSPCKYESKLKQTLTEIKEIAEKIDDSGGCAYGDYDCDNCSSLEQETVCTYKVKKLILQKISECEVDNEQ